MDNKLSELSKPVFEIEVSCGHWLNCTSGKLTPDASADFSDWPDGVNRLYSQEYVSALLAELEFEKQNNAGVAGMVEDYETKLAEKDKRIAELEDRLSTPVRLPAARFCPSEYEGSLLWSETESHNKAISDCAGSLRAAGFTVEGVE